MQGRRAAADPRGDRALPGRSRERLGGRRGPPSRKQYRFKNFREALAFTNRVGELAEEIGHHPDIELAWGRVALTVFTHKIGGLNEADFVFAAKADRALGSDAAG